MTTGTDTNKATIAPDIPIQKLPIVNPTIKIAIALKVIGTSAEFGAFSGLVRLPSGRTDK
jgi:hypothetical protein